MNGRQDSSVPQTPPPREGTRLQAPYSRVDQASTLRGVSMRATKLGPVREWPSVVVTQCFAPAHGLFDPGVAFVPIDPFPVRRDSPAIRWPGETRRRTHSHAAPRAVTRSLEWQAMTSRRQVEPGVGGVARCCSRWPSAVVWRVRGLKVPRAQPAQAPRFYGRYEEDARRAASKSGFDLPRDRGRNGRRASNVGLSLSIHCYVRRWADLG